MKRPAFQFYAADWRKDAALQSCSLAAQGLWINAMCVAHECEPYGHLSVNGKPMTTAQIGRLVGISTRDCEKLMAELDGAGVPSRAEDGAIYSRRMVRDERVRNVRAAGGKAGAEHGIKGAEHGNKGGRPANATGVKEPPLYPPPSSSASSSASAKSSAASVAGNAQGQNPKVSQMAEWLRAAGLNGVSPSNVKLHQYAEEGYTQQQITEAVRIAVEERGKTLPFSFTYIAGILSDIKRPPDRKTPDAWWLDDAKTMAKAQELGVVTIGKGKGQLQQDIHEAIAKRKADVSRDTGASA